MKQIGVLSDTHGTLRNQVVAALQGSDIIFHTGDVGDLHVLDALRKLAPVVAVRGNTDGGDLGQRLPVTEMTTVDGYYFYLLHDYQRLDIDPVAAGIHAIVSGHTHQPMIHWDNGLLLLNPGSASLARHGGPLSLGRIRVLSTGLDPEIIIIG